MDDDEDYGELKTTVCKLKADQYGNYEWTAIVDDSNVCDKWAEKF
jgi:hypothetical protein